MKTKTAEPREAIIITLPKQFFEEQNHAAYLQELQDLDGDHVWYRICKNLPTQDVLYVYTIIDNKVHHRTNFVGLERNKDYRFARPDGQWREFKNANAILMGGPAVMAPFEIAYKGFQGFRYCNKLF